MLSGCALTLTDQATGAVRKTTSNAQRQFHLSQPACRNLHDHGDKGRVQGAVARRMCQSRATVTTPTLGLEIGAARKW